MYIETILEFLYMSRVAGMNLGINIFQENWFQNQSFCQKPCAQAVSGVKTTAKGWLESSNRNLYNVNTIIMFILTTDFIQS